MTEEERAALWRSSQQARCQAIAARERGLAGDVGARMDLDAAWQPVLLASLETQAPDDDCLRESEQLA
jgi:hypothetical protein